MLKRGRKSVVAMSFTVAALFSAVGLTAITGTIDSALALPAKCNPVSGPVSRPVGRPSDRPVSPPVSRPVGQPTGRPVGPPAGPGCRRGPVSPPASHPAATAHGHKG
jgi:hypothetical protein